MSERPPESDPPTSKVVAELADRHRELLAFVERRVGSRADAEDILQAAFVRGVEHAGGIRDDESTAAWFYRVLRNAIVDHARRRASAGRAQGALSRELEPEAALAPIPDEVCTCVRELARTLKAEYAAALQRVEVDGVSVQDFAAEAGISANNAGVRLFRAREALRNRVKATCGACAEHGCLDCTCSHPPGTAEGCGGHAGRDRAT